MEAFSLTIITTVTLTQRKSSTSSNHFIFKGNLDMILNSNPQFTASLLKVFEYGEASVPRVSRKYDKVKLGQKQGNVSLPAGLRKHLGKGRSALVSSKRRDDSLLQQHDWIQGAILHCNNSFNASAECETSQLPRSVSNVSPELSENSKNDECL